MSSLEIHRLNISISFPFFAHYFLKIVVASNLFTENFSIQAEKWNTRKSEQKANVQIASVEQYTSSSLSDNFVYLHTIIPMFPF